MSRSNDNVRAAGFPVLATNTRSFEPVAVGQTLHEKSSASGHARGGPNSVEAPVPFSLANCPKIEIPKNRDNPLAVIEGGRPVAAALDAYKSLRTRLMRLQNGRALGSVVITSASQSDGKTVTAFNLACCTAQLEDTPVLLIDADLRTHALTSLIGKLPPVGLAEVLKGTISYEEAIVRTDIPNLYVMGAGQDDNSSAELFATERWSQFMHWTSESFKMVLVDSLPIGIVAESELIAPACDGVVVVVRSFSTPRRALEEAIAQVDPKKLLGVIWNAAQPAGNLDPYTYDSSSK
jgi:capsular exopolysaccharide synthesis family protein